MKNRKSRIHLHTQQNKKGFTLAEFLIAAGILAILAAFGFVAVTSYQRKLKLTEMDDTAREIFVAAQNHLTAAKASGEWDELCKKYDDKSSYWVDAPVEKPSDYMERIPGESWEKGLVEADGNKLHEYHMISVVQSKREELNDTVFSLLLPNGAIDPQIAEGGTYIIEYDALTATIYGVFYTDQDVSAGLSIAAYYDLNEDKEIREGMGTGRDDSAIGRAIRREYDGYGRNVIIGYYGGAMAEKITTGSIESPIVKVNNAETLSLSITDPNAKEYKSTQTRVAVEITGEESGKKETWPLTLNDVGSDKATNGSGNIWNAWAYDVNANTYTLTFDDITKENGHFADLFPDFIPGENLIIKVSCTSNKILAPTQYAEAYTNSLFESRHNLASSSGSGKAVNAEDMNNENKSEVTIACIRHLQNLSPAVSKLPTGVTSTTSKMKNNTYVTSAVQTDDLDWNSTEAQNVYGNAPILIYSENVKEKVTNGHFYGIQNYGLEKYTGEKNRTEENKEIRNLTIQGQDSACGLFTQIGGTSGGTGANSQKLEVSNLTLSGFTVEAEKETGVLAGYVNQTATLDVNNVLIIDPTVNSVEGGAGGLVGTLTNGRITGCGVYFVSDEEKNTNEKSNSDTKETGAQKYEKGACNITRLGDDFKNGKYHIWSGDNGSAGGLIGDATGNVTTEDCFASVPVITKNGSAGGLLGCVQGENVSVKNSYVGGYTQEKDVKDIYGIVMTGNNITTGSAAGGLIGVSQGKVTVENSYSTASVYGYNAGGFVGRDGSGSSYRNCYTVSKVETFTIGDAAKDNTKVGAFASVLGKEVKLNHCYYVRDINASLSGTKERGDKDTGIIGLYYEELKTAIFDNTSNSEKETTPLLASEKVRHATYPYDAARYSEGKVPEEELYPFATVNDTAKKTTDSGMTGTHVGDWIENNNQKIGLVYYEKIWNEGNNKADSKTYYNGYAYNSNMPESTQKDILSSGVIENTDAALITGPNQYVTEDGYLLLIPKGWSLEKLNISIEGKQQVTADKIFKTDAAEGILTKEDSEIYDAYYLDLTKVEGHFIDGEYNHVTIKGGVQADFTMTPDFADSVVCGNVTDEKTFKIRGARHLAQLQGTNAYTGYNTHTNYTFEQELDVDFSDSRQPITYADGIKTTFDASIANFCARYISQQYRDADNNVCSYKIRGLSKTLFTTIGNSGVVKGIVLTNLVCENLANQVVAAGFVMTNMGSIESCNIRSDYNKELTKYEDNSILSDGDSGNAAGFVFMNSGKISNSSVTGMISLKESAKQAGGFVYINMGTISYSYANCVINAIDISNKETAHLSGFCVENQGGNILECHATGSIVSAGNSVQAYGFVNDNSGKIINSYAAQWSLECKTAYYFGRNYQQSTSIGVQGITENCFYLSDMFIISGAVIDKKVGNYIPAGKAKTYQELKDTVTSHATQKTTKKYKQYNTDKSNVYPFNLPNQDESYTTMQHYGDWPSNETLEELVYYEVYKTKGGQYTLGLYNEDLKIDSLDATLADGTRIIQDGYALLTTAEGEYKVNGKDCYSIADMKDSNTSISVLGRKIDNATWSTESGVLAADTKLTLDENSYLLKFFGLDTVDDLSGNTYYSKITVTGGNTDRYFYYNPHYAKSAMQNCHDNEEEQLTLKTPNNSIIRTERQYSMMTQDLQNPGDKSLNSAFAVYASQSFLQELDLNYGSDMVYTKKYFGADTSRAASTAQVAATVPVTAAANSNAGNAPQDTLGFRGTYNGGSKSINNLTIIQSGNQSAGMFGNTQGATIKNVVLNNITLTKGDGENAEYSDYTGALIGSAAHYTSGSTTNATTVDNITINKGNIIGKNYVGGLIGAAQSCSVTNVREKEMTVEGDSSVGGVVGYLTNWGQKITSGFEYSKITLSGENTISETAKNTNAATAGLGGFAGRVRYETPAMNRRIIFSGITLANDNSDALNITVENTTSKDARIYAGSFIGKLHTEQNITETNPSFSKCIINNTTITAGNRSGDGANYTIGGLIGLIETGAETYKDSVMNLNTGLTLGGNVKIISNTDKDSTGKCVVGGLIGYVNKWTTIGLPSNAAAWNRPQYTGFNAQNTLALGGYVGMLDGYSELSGYMVNTLDFGNLTLPESVSASYLGGVVGIVNGSSRTGAFAADSVTANIQADNCYAGGFIGGVAKTAAVGSITAADVHMSMTNSTSSAMGAGIGSVSGGTVTDITVSGGTLAVQDSERSYAGSCIGSINQGTLSGIKASNTTVSVSGGNSAAGGCIGVVSGGNITNSSADNMRVQSTSAGYIGGFAGLIVGGSLETKISVVHVNDTIVTGNADYAGGFAASLTAATIKNCDVRSETLKGGNYTKDGSGNYIAGTAPNTIMVSSDKENASIGGFAGRIMGANISDSFSAVPVIAEAEGSIAGGFSGINDNVVIYNSYASCDVSNTGYTQPSSTGGFAGTIQGVNNIFDCYATGDVYQGATVGGFAGSLMKSSITYLNNCYSLGQVDQQTRQTGEGILHGGFVGSNVGQIMKQPTDLLQGQVGKFYQMLSLDLENLDASGLNLTDDEKRKCNDCLRALIKREGGKGLEDIDKLNGNTSVEKYFLSKTGIGQVDSTATLGGQNSGLGADKPSVTSIVQALLDISAYEDIGTRIKTWRLTPDKDKQHLIFLYSTVDLQIYTTDEVEKSIENGNPYSISGFRYEYNTDREMYYQTRGNITLSTKNDAANYGHYIVLNEFTEAEGTYEPVPDLLTAEKYTGCTYLRDENYNNCDTWSDSKEDFTGTVSHKTYKDMTDAKGEYLEQLNTDIGDNNTTSSAARFAIPAVNTFNYDKSLEGSYPFPTLTGKTGAGNGEITHWGDWPEQQETSDIPDFDFGLVYYEKIQGDDTVYYHGWGATYSDNPDNKDNYVELMTPGEGLINGLVTGPDKYVVEDGYLVFLPQTLELENIKIQAGWNPIQGNELLTSYTDNSLSAIQEKYGSYKVEDSKIASGESNYFNRMRDFVVLAEIKDGWSSVWKEKAKFIMTPHFGDSVLCTSNLPEEKIYNIRSAKQLMSFNKLNLNDSQDEDTKKRIFKQLLDISFTNGSTTLEMNNAKKVMLGTYISERYGDGTQSYKIQGLETCMFITNAGTLKGITLTDVQIKDTQDATAGLVITNAGKIDSCSIRPDKVSSDAYEKVLVSSTNSSAAGLVSNNAQSGEISNSYVSGTVSANKASGFVSENNGKITNSYANCLVTGKVSASGFCGYAGEWGNNQDNAGMITNSSCTGSVKTDNAAYGFISHNTGSIKNCYSSLFEITGKEIYMFGYKSWKQDGVENAYWMKNTSANGTIKTESEIGSPKPYSDLQAEGTSPTTHKYNSSYVNTDKKNTTYPFRLESTKDAYLLMQHWGDWPAKPAIQNIPAKLALVYYEILEGEESILYYHGYDEAGNEIGSHAERAADNGLAEGADKIVKESGYLVITNTRYSGNAVNGSINGGKSENLPKLFSESSEFSKYFEQDSGVTIYKVDENLQKGKFHDDRVNTIRFSKANDIDATFTLTPYFADTIQFGNQTANKDQTFAVRSAEHLQNLQELKDFSENKDYDYTFLQQLDIDAAKLTKSIDDFSEIYQVAAAGNDFGYKIMNLKIPLFDEINEGAMVDGITISGCQIVTNEDDGAAALALENKGTIQNCAIISGASERTYAANTIMFQGDEDEDDGAAGFVVENKKEGIIRNCSVTAVVTGKSATAGFVVKNEGTIETSYSNCIVVSQDGDAAGFCYTNMKNAEIADSHSLLQVTAEKGTAYGFIVNNDNGAKVKNCYTALQKLAGKNTNTFGGNAGMGGDNYYLKEVEITTENNGSKTESGTGKTYKELSAMASTAPATTDTTVKYGRYNINPADTIYPFALPSAPTTGNAWFIMKHYGDWPESSAKTRMFTAQQDADTQEPNRDSVQPEDTNTSQPNPIAGIAYREADDSGYEGWYAITADGADGEVTTNDQTPYDTLRTDKNIALADDAVSYGILTEAGTKPRVSGVQAEEEITSQVTIDNVLYDYYKIIPAEESHQDITLIVNTGGKEFAFTYNPDFAAAVSYEMSLGTAAEEGGRPYQIRTEAQLRNINENAKFYLNAAYRQTLDIMLGDENFAPIGGVASWADGDFDEKAQDSAVSFAGSYDAGLVKDGRRSTDSSQEEEQEGNSDEVRLPEGYSITGLNQTVILSERDSGKQMYTGLFAAVSGTIRNVNLSGDINLTQTAEDSLMIVYAGSIAGFLTETGDMAGCNSDVAFHMGAGCTEINVGGLVGYSAGNIGDSYYNGAIDGTVKLAGVKGRTAVVGGALGTNTGSVTRSAACAVISLKVENRNKDTDSYLGGFAGQTYGKDSFITDSWSKSFLEGDGSVAGGFAGLISGDRKKYTTLTDNYAVVSILNPEKVKSAGLFAGYAQTDQIWRCHAVSLDGDVAASQVFANGTAVDWESRGCYLMPGTDSSLLAVLNGGGMYELVNGMYPTLHDNPEREYDMIKVTSTGGNLQRKEPENQTHETSGEAENSAQSTVPEKEGSSIPDTGSEEENKGSAANPEEGNEGSVSDPEEGNKDGADTDSSESTTAKDPDADSNGKGTNADGGGADAADSGQEKNTSAGVTESGSSSIK